jgi:hypothetical protein
MVIPRSTDRISLSDGDGVRRCTTGRTEQAILHALNDAKSQRALYSPAEALNVLTIGAAHGALPANLIDPFTDGGLRNIVSAMGLGFKRVVMRASHLSLWPRATGTKLNGYRQYPLMLNLTPQRGLHRRMHRASLLVIAEMCFGPERWRQAKTR